MVAKMKERVIELDHCIITSKNEHVVHVHFKDGHLVQDFEVQEMFERVAEERNGKRCLLMVSVGVGTTMTNEARVLASAQPSSDYVAADAIIMRDFAHQLAANVFMRHNRPNRPIKIFPDETSALEWLNGYHHLVDGSMDPRSS